MSYIITAEVDTTVEVNQGADRSKMDAQWLSYRGGYITFDVRGEFNEERRRELVLGLCRTLVDAGYFEFRISHSY